MNDHSHITARLTHRYDAAPGDVFDAWLDPDSVQRWMGAALAESAPGTELLRVEVDARVGGTFRFIDSRDPEQAGPTGIYLEIDRPHRLAFTWLPEKGEHSIVTIDITTDGDGALLTLTHEMEATWADYLNRTQETWERMAEQVGRHLST